MSNWLHAQDQVFNNCSSSSDIPGSAPAGSSEIALADRAYQIAAAYFYAGSFDDARAKWRQVGADKHSPWRVWAPYLIARSYLRQGAYKDAQAQLNAVLSDPSEALIHRQASYLLDYALAQIDPSTQFLALSKRLTDHNDVFIGHDLNDYAFLFDRFQTGFDSEFTPGATPEQMQTVIQHRIDRLQAVAAQNDLTAWILEFQMVWAKSHDEIQRWRKTTSLPWLLAAANQVKPNTPDERDVINALTHVSASSPGYAAARFDAARLLIYDKRNGEAAQLLDEALEETGDSQSFDASTRNALHAERLKIAPTFQDFVRDAPRTVVFIQDETETGDDNQFEGHVPIRPPKPASEPAQSFDLDATSTFNYHLPMSLWRKAVEDTSLPASLRAEIAQAGWVRSILLDQPPNSLAGELASLKPSYAPELQSLSDLASGERKFSAVFWILHQPELSPALRAGLGRETSDGHISEYRDNWWCSLHAPPEQPAGQSSYFSTGMTGILEEFYPPWQQPNASFLTGEEKSEVTKEAGTLTAAGSAPSFLSSVVVSWAQAHPDDYRNAEALALAVKTSRVTCQNLDKAPSVERAFHLLHERYPNSTWAKSTPYWY